MVYRGREVVFVLDAVELPARVNVALAVLGLGPACRVVGNEAHKRLLGNHSASALGVTLDAHLKFPHPVRGQRELCPKDLAYLQPRKILRMLCKRGKKIKK